MDLNTNENDTNDQHKSQRKGQISVNLKSEENG